MDHPQDIRPEQPRRYRRAALAVAAGALWLGALVGCGGEAALLTGRGVGPTPTAAPEEAALLAPQGK